MNETTLRVRGDRPVGTISPRLYGQFAEHLGRCCYDGLWIGNQQTDIPTYGGFRKDVVDALKAMPVPLLRWPGGCYADHYHWRDGIGERTTRLGMSCGLQVEDDNSLGTHEFVALCRMLGAEPYLAGNMGSGSVQEMCDWVEYCNTSVRTSLQRERAANGSEEPFNVKLWGVGNENWGCGGSYDIESYANEYRRYATMLQHVDPTAELVACGHNDAWNKAFFEINKQFLWLMDHYSIHYYWINGGPEIDFSEDQYYTLIGEADSTENFVRRTADMYREAFAQAGNDSRLKGRKVSIALDEWGVWHPEARSWGPNGEIHREPTTYEQAGTIRDAVAVAVALEGFHHQCNVLGMANLAQVVNVLHASVMTEGAAMWVTPSYFVFQLHKPHIGATALPVDVTQGATIPYGFGATAGTRTSAVSATASRGANGTAVTATNRHYDQPASVTLSVPDSTKVVQAQILASDSARDGNSAEQPNRVKLADLRVSADGGNWRIELPPHAVATVVFN
ncbi:MAG: alpha-N-arabinofuranosidase [Anaerolineae bacterium]|nr:alpha-N-arabinofuranosidase [Anaerolineae bacterium]